MASLAVQVREGLGTKRGHSKLSGELFQLDLGEQLDEKYSGRTGWVAVNAWSWDDFATYPTLL
jgi:hypothetical protein